MKIYLTGFMGSGKSYWGRLLSQQLGLPFFDLDEQVEGSEGVPITEVFASKGEEYFRQLEKETLHIISESHDSFVMAVGGGTPCYFNNIGYMKEQGETVWINTPLDTLYKRLVNEKDKRPLLRDLSDEQLRAFISKKFSDRRIYYEQAGIHIDDEPLQPEKLIELLFHA